MRECVTPDNGIDFMNQFFTDTEVVSTDMAQEIRDRVVLMPATPVKNLEQPLVPH